MCSFFWRAAGVLALLLIALSQAKSVNAQVLNNVGNYLSETYLSNPFTGMSVGEGVGAVAGFGARTNVITGPAMYLYDRIAGNDTIADRLDPRAVTERSGETGEITNRETAAAMVERNARQAILGPTGQGSILDTLTARLVGFIAFIMGLIVAFLGKIILLLVNVLLGFLTYNGFSTAPPVVIGWKMVRDLVNMFFIVILILSSYATILGWRTNELHVKTILPKVLLAAVLVNFSKTIVSMLIDASQIVMLTFVNAFGAIGAGNFTNALHLPLIQGASYGQQLQANVSSSAAAVATAGAGQVILDVILAAGFQIFLLVVAIGVMLMMVIFVVARIVGLWMLLIFSPVPFLASALPGTMKKVLGGQVEKYWGRLSGLLTGGPIMAFWLWLTFATLSAQGADERLGLFENTQAAQLGNTFGMVQNGASMFITAIGNAQGLGSYLVAIAMMMMGLEAAMDAANAVGGSAGDLMKKVGNKSRDWGQRAALFAAGGGAIAGAGLALRGGRAVGSAVGGAAFGAIDRRYDVRAKLAGAARKVPFASQNKWLRDQQNYNRNEEGKRRAEYEKIMNDPNLSASEKAFEMKKIGRNEFWTGDRAGTKAVEGVKVSDAMKKGTNEKAFADELKARQDATKAGVKGTTGDDLVAKRVSERAAKEESNRLRLEQLEKGKAAISDVGKTEKEIKDNKELRQKFDDEIKKIRTESPHLILDEAEREKQMAQVRQNYSTLSEDAKGNFEVLKNVAYEGAFNTAADGTVTVGDKAAVARTRKKLQGKDRENFDTMVRYIEESNGGIASAQLRNLSVERDSYDKAHVFATTTTRDAQGNLVSSTGGYQTSYRQQQAIDDITTNINASTAQGAPGAPGWMTKNYGGPIMDISRSDRLTQASKTVGVGKAIGSLPEGNDRNGNSYRDAGARGVSVQSGAMVQAATAYLDQQRSYTDQSGEAVTKSNGEILQMGPKAPPGVRDLVNAEYQERVREVLPVLDGVDELNQAQQVQFMADMGAANVGQALDTRLMSDPAQLESVRRVKAMVNENATAVNQWFSEGYTNDKAQMDDYAQYRAREQWKGANQGIVQNMQGMQRMPAADRDTFIETMSGPRDQAHVDWKTNNAPAAQNMENMRKMSDSDRETFIRGMSGSPADARAAKAQYESYAAKETKEEARQQGIRESKAAYADYVAKETAQGAIASRYHGSQDWNRGYAEYSKYANAASAVEQFKRNPGKNSGANRQRGAGGGNPRQRRQKP